MSIKVTHPTFVNGNEQSCYDIECLISMVVSSRDQIKKWRDVGVKSSTIESLIAEEEAGITDLVKVLDEREVK